MSNEKNQTYGEFIEEMNEFIPNKESPSELWKEAIQNRNLLLIPSKMSKKFSQEQLDQINEAVIDELVLIGTPNANHSFKILVDNPNIPKRLRCLLSSEPGKYMIL